MRAKGAVLSFVIILGLFSLVNNVLAKGAGTTAFSFLEICPSARAAAMGEANVALGDTAGEVVYGNPASLTMLKNQQFSFGYLKYWEGVKIGSANYSRKIGANSGTEIGVVYLDSGLIPLTTEDSRGAYYETSGSFKAQDKVINIVYGARLFDSKVSAGLSARIVEQKIYTAVARHINFDAGGLYEMRPGQVNLGLIIENIGAAVNSEELPQKAKIGLSLKNKILFPADLVTNFDYACGLKGNIVSRYNLGWD
ncbi:MAG: PorV/PorQ family protein, partial [Elusimicrobia bacterium]|nr:PorV/PorQ family protein [Elusimicrobiota bacterium]